MSTAVKSRLDITLPVSDLRAAMSALRPVPTKRPMVPVLGGVLFTVERGTLYATRSDYEVTVRVRVAKGVASAPPCLVSFTQFRDAVRAIAPKSAKDRMARLTDTGTRIALEAAGNRVQLMSMLAEDFPPLTIITGDPAARLVVDRDDLATEVRRVVTSAGRDDTLPMLTGVRVEVTPGNLRMATTDRFRLSMVDVQATTRNEWQGLIPAVALRAIVDALPAGRVDITVTDGLVIFTTDGVRSTARLLDIEFVKYRSLIPKAPALVAVSASDLREAVNLAYVTMTSRKLWMATTENTLQIGAGGHDTGWITSRPLHLDADPGIREIAFNPAYLIDALDSTPVAADGTVTLGFSHGPHPLYVATSRENVSGDSGPRHLVMPARMENGIPKEWLA